MARNRAMAGAGAKRMGGAGIKPTAPKTPMAGKPAGGPPPAIGGGMGAGPPHMAPPAPKPPMGAPAGMAPPAPGGGLGPPSGGGGMGGSGGFEDGGSVPMGASRFKDGGPVGKPVGGSPSHSADTKPRVTGVGGGRKKAS